MVFARRWSFAALGEQKPTRSGNNPLHRKGPDFMIRSIMATALVAAAFAAPATATTVMKFQGSGTNVASVTRTSGPFGVTVTAARFFVDPAALTDFAQISGAGAKLLSRGTGGLGITGGGSNTQMDTNVPGTVAAPGREAFLLTGTQAFRLNGLRLAQVDGEDTVAVFGVRADNTLVNFGLGSGTSATIVPGAVAAGTIIGGAGGTLLNNTRNSSLDGGTNTFLFANTSNFTRYLITTRVGGEVTYLGSTGQGFTLGALTATVPEPQTWLMLVVGFGLVGLGMRRRIAATA